MCTCELLLVAIRSAINLLLLDLSSYDISSCKSSSTSNSIFTSIPSGRSGSTFSSKSSNRYIMST